MEKIRIEPPDSWTFQTEMVVRVADLNYGNHVGNDRYFLYAQEARCRWLKSLGFENEIVVEPPIGTIVTEASIQYLAEAYHGDTLVIKLGNSKVHRFGFDQIYELTKGDITIARIHQRLFFFDFNRRKIASPSKDVIDKLI